MNRGLRAPERVVILRIKDREQSVADGHIDQRKGARILRERCAVRGNDLSCGRIKHRNRRADCIKSRHIRAIRRPLNTIDISDRLYLVVVKCVLFAGECGWRFRTKLVAALDTKRRYVPPMEKDSPSWRASWCWPPLAWIG